MAHYIRYEVYLPVRYHDPGSRTVRSIEPTELTEFLDVVAQKYHGYTQANPMTAPPFRGVWEGEVDELIFAFVLVPSSDADTSLADFTRWKSELEQRYHQQIVLVIYFPVQIIGGI
jgi:hypothetical protein